MVEKKTEHLIWQAFDENYRAASQTVTVHGIKQRWLLIESKHAQKRELESFTRRLDKKTTELTNALWHLGNQLFSCSTDAEHAIKPLLKSLKHHRIDYKVVPVLRFQGRGRPKPDAEKTVIGYQIEATATP